MGIALGLLLLVLWCQYLVWKNRFMLAFACVLGILLLLIMWFGVGTVIVSSFIDLGPLGRQYATHVDLGSGVMLLWITSMAISFCTASGLSKTMSAKDAANMSYGYLIKQRFMLGTRSLPMWSIPAASLEWGILMILMEYVIMKA